MSQMHTVLQYVRQLSAGKYMLRRRSGSTAVHCLRAVPDALGGAARVDVQDLTERLRDAGATDADKLDFVPIRWQARAAAAMLRVRRLLMPAISRRRLHTLAFSKSRSRTRRQGCPACCRVAPLARSGCSPTARRRLRATNQDMRTVGIHRRSGV